MYNIVQSSANKSITFKENIATISPKFNIILNPVDYLC